MNNCLLDTNKTNHKTIMSRPQKRHRNRDNQDIDTRQALLDAVLELMNQDKSFDGISLRNVTKEVGISPGAFYRHFANMDALGLELVNSSFKTLRDLLRTVRQVPVQEQDITSFMGIVNRSVQIFVTYVRAHRTQFQFIARERFGGVAALREAIDRELKMLASELATDLARFATPENWTTEDLQMLANLMIGAMMRIVEQVLMAPRSGERDEELVRMAEKQLRLIILGAIQWRSESSE